MNLTQVIAYGGTYEELWDENYKLSIRYSGQQFIELELRAQAWVPAHGGIPQLPLADFYFQQAAHAAVAARQFVASGLTAQVLSNLCPAFCEGAVFAAECLRILMDEYGLPLETIYPYVAICMNSDLSDTELQQLELLQPRTAHVLRMLQDMKKRLPAVRHDLRLPQYRTPFGALRTGESVRFSVAVSYQNITDVSLEVYGDAQSFEVPMVRMQNVWQADLIPSAQPAALWYRFHLLTGSGEFWICAAEDGIHAAVFDRAQDGFRLTVFDRDFETPAWFQHAVLYQIFPDRFAFSDDGTAERGIAYHRQLGQNTELHASLQEEVRWKPRRNERSYLPDDFYGGTLKGIAAKLPELKEMGFNCLYLNPVFEARSNHRYDTSDYLKIDPVLGSNEDFEALCHQARALGIHILCDGVFSHTGADSVYFNRDGHYPNSGACQRESSPYDSWYEFRHFPDDYRSWWGYRELPEVEETDPGWQSFVVTGTESVLRQWLRRGASGWRLDVADELPDEVLELMRRTVKEEGADNLLLGEVWEDAVIKESYGKRRSYALGRALDTVMNYPFRTAVLDFLLGRSSAFALADFLTGQQLHYPQPMHRSLMNLLGSHDVERLRTALATGVVMKDLKRQEQLELEKAVRPEKWQTASSLMRLAYVIAYSIPGVPSVYYGDELGMTGVNDPFNRRPYGIHAEDDLREFLTELSRRRGMFPALKEGYAFYLAACRDVLLILRCYGNDAVVTAVNRSQVPEHYSIFLDGTDVSGAVPALGWDSVQISA